MFIDSKKKSNKSKLNDYKRKSVIRISITTTVIDAYRVSFVKLDQVLFCSLMSIYN